MLELPKQYIDNVRHFARNGEKWLEELPELIQYCEERWSLKIHSPFELSYNYVAPATNLDGDSFVVKLSIPNEEFLTEVEATKQFNGRGMVRLLDYNTEKGVQILERVSPGKTLAELEDDETATRVAANALKRLHQKAPRDNTIIPPITDWEDKLKRICMENPNGLGPISAKLLAEAKALYSYMTSSMSGELFLLHGDFHHYNILSKSDGTWVAIDPKGLLGEREYDLIQFLLNKLPSEHIAEVIGKRIAILVDELALNEARFWQWGFCHAVLSTSWSVTDEGDYSKPFFKAINVFRDYLLQNDLLHK
jgi:streptomycin 6-kinase